MGHIPKSLLKSCWLPTPNGLQAMFKYKFITLLLNDLVICALKEVPLLAILTRNITSNFFSLSSCQHVSTIPEKYRMLKNRHFVRVCTEKMMDRQYRETAREIYIQTIIR